METKTVGIVVTYEPDAGALLRLVHMIGAELDRVIVVDNASSSSVEHLLAAEACSVVSLPGNEGIAAAQNKGVAAARDAQADYVIFFDQDSEPPAGMIRDLIRRASRLPQDVLGAIGPRPFDRRLHRKLPPMMHDTAVEVDHLISSGCLVPLRAIDAVGPMNETLFIDLVDIEWCLRAHRKGLKTYVCPDLVMPHSQGTPMKALGYTFASHSPMRHYYLVRNAIWLWRQSWVPLRWKLRSLPRLLGRIALNAAFAKPGRAQRGMMWKGLRHAFAGTMGRGHDR